MIKQNSKKTILKIIGKINTIPAKSPPPTKISGKPSTISNLSLAKSTGRPSGIFYLQKIFLRQG